MSFLLSLFLLASPVKAQDEGDGTMNTPGLISTGGYVLYYNVDGPLAMVTQVSRPKDSTYLGEVIGRSCQHGLSIPISASLQAQTISGAGGDGSYRKALLEIKRAHPDLVGIYDVKVDVAQMSILRVYQRLCTIVTARGYK
jgi:hypothetical protein